MSIWSTVDGPRPELLDAIPHRDNYSGAPLDPPSTFYIDVATSPTYHACIRLTVANGEMIAVDEARELVATLERAIAIIEADHPPATSVIEVDGREVRLIGGGS